MNQRLVDLLTDDDAVAMLRAGLPFAFEEADVEAGRMQVNRRTRVAQSAVGQEVGVLRERILQGFLICQLGHSAVRLPEPGAPMVDIAIDREPLEIKSSTRRGLVTAKWTSDNSAVDRVLEEFDFESDMLLVRIWWGQEKDSIFCIPVEVLREEAGRYDGSYLTSARNTNNRGVKIRDDFMQAVETHPGTTRVSIDWQRSAVEIPAPITRRVNYWNEVRVGH